VTSNIAVQKANNHKTYMSKESHIMSDAKYVMQPYTCRIKYFL